MQLVCDRPAPTTSSDLATLLKCRAAFLEAVCASGNVTSLGSQLPTRLRNRALVWVLNVRCGIPSKFESAGAKKATSDTFFAPLFRHSCAVVMSLTEFKPVNKKSQEKAFRVLRWTCHCWTVLPPPPSGNFMYFGWHLVTVSCIQDFTHEFVSFLPAKITAEASNFLGALFGRIWGRPKKTQSKNFARVLPCLSCKQLSLWHKGQKC